MGCAPRSYDRGWGWLRGGNGSTWRVGWRISVGMMNRFRELFPRVVQFGPPRTGSTLVWNAMRVMLPGRRIPKRHDLNVLLRRGCFGSRIVCTIRNPLDAIASSIRRYKLEPSPGVIESQIREFQRNGMDEMPDLVRRRNVLILKYEEFYRDFDRLFDPLEDFFGTSADAPLRERFKVEFDVRRIKQASEQLGEFGNFSSEILIHGGHVSERLGEPGGHDGYFDAQSERRIRDAFAWHFETFAYGRGS